MHTRKIANINARSRKRYYSPLSLSLSLSQFANGLSPPFSPMFYTRSSLLFIFNRICKNFFNIWIYPDRTEIKIANINARSKKILFPFFFSFFTIHEWTLFIRGYSMYFFLLFIFNGICKTFFNVWISMRITFVAFFQSTFRLQSAPKTGQTRSHEFVNPSIILSLTFFHHHIFFLSFSSVEISPEQFSQDTPRYRRR